MPDWHAHHDSAAPGARPVGLGPTPPHSTDDLAAALHWTATVKWGAMWLSYRGRDPEQTWWGFVSEARRLGYELTHRYRGQGDATWRFRVQAVERQEALDL